MDFRPKFSGLWPRLRLSGKDGQASDSRRVEGGRRKRAQSRRQTGVEGADAAICLRGPARVKKSPFCSLLLPASALTSPVIGAGCFAEISARERAGVPPSSRDDWGADRHDYDPDFVGKIPDEVSIHRIAEAPTPHGFYQRFFLRKIAPYIWPHRAPILWWKKARAKVLSLLSENRFDAVWATSNPE